MLTILCCLAELPWRKWDRSENPLSKAKIFFSVSEQVVTTYCIKLHKLSQVSCHRVLSLLEKLPFHLCTNRIDEVDLQMLAAFYHIEMCFLNFSDSSDAFPSKVLFCHFPGHFSPYNYFLYSYLKEKYYSCSGLSNAVVSHHFKSLAFLLLADPRALVRCKTQHMDQFFQAFLHHLGSLS